MGKVLSWGEFLDSLWYSRLVPELAMVTGIAVLVVAIELFIALSLVWKHDQDLGWVGTMIAASIFAAYHGWRMIMGLTAPCNCFGALFTISAPAGIAMNVALFTLSAWRIRSENGVPILMTH
jgi:hypothetical protein